MARHRFPQTFSPKRIGKLIRQGILQNARFAAAVLVKGVNHGKTADECLLLRSDCAFPTLYQIRQQGRFTTPVAYATAHMAALFIKFFPRELAGVFTPEMLPAETRRRSEEHTSELQSRLHLVCRLLLEKKKERN